jgi:hypothetical protein
LPSSTLTIANAKPPGEWVAGNSADLSWNAVTGAEQYNIYKDMGGYFGLAGISEGLAWRDFNYDPTRRTRPRSRTTRLRTATTPGPWPSISNGCGSGETTAHPNTVYASQTGNFENFNKSRPLKADDSLEFALASGGAQGSINQISWLAPFGDMIIGTAGAEFQMSGGGDEAITPDNVIARPQSYWGSSGVQPIIVGDGVLHVQRQGSKVRDLFYSLEKDGYSGNDLSVLSDHLFDGRKIVAWAYQQMQDSVVWCVRDDGILLGMTYLKEHQIWGWHRHETEGVIESVAVVPGDIEDILYLSVKRTVGEAEVRHIERMAKKWRREDGISAAWYVDDGLEYEGEPVTSLSGLDHLEGFELSGLLDGSPVQGLLVEDGAIALPRPASRVIVGLPYSGCGAPLPIEVEYQSGTTQGSPRAIGKVFLRVSEPLAGRSALAALVRTRKAFCLTRCRLHQRTGARQYSRFLVSWRFLHLAGMTLKSRCMLSRTSLCHSTSCRSSWRWHFDPDPYHGRREVGPHPGRGGRADRSALARDRLAPGQGAP